MHKVWPNTDINGLLGEINKLEDDANYMCLLEVLIMSLIQRQCQSYINSIEVFFSSSFSPPSTHVTHTVPLMGNH